MKRVIACALALALLLQGGLAEAAGLFPWRFGMSREQVTSFTGQGPYKSFTNGDLETYNGVFDGRRENVQFFFDERGLYRIGVYLYEGTDADEAVNTWLRAHQSLEKTFGTVEVRGMHREPPSEPPTPEVLSTFASVNTKLSGKTQMAPVKQPEDMFVFSNFHRREIGGKIIYLVIIYFDPTKG